MNCHSLRTFFLAISLALGAACYAQQPTPEEIKQTLTEFYNALLQHKNEHDGKWPAKQRALTGKADEVFDKLAAIGRFRGGFYSPAGEDDGITSHGRHEDWERILGKKAPLFWFYDRKIYKNWAVLADGTVLEGMNSAEEFWKLYGPDVENKSENKLTLLLRDEENRPLANATVLVSGRTIGKTAIPNQSYSGNDAGEVAIFLGPELSPDLTLEIRRSGYFMPIMKLPPTERAAKKVIRVKKYASIGGAVLNKEGKAEAGVRVEATLETTSQDGNLIRRVLESVNTGTDGTWELAAVPLNAGDIILKLSKDDYMNAEYFVEENREADPSSISPNKLLEKSAQFTLQPLGKWNITVVDELGKPVTDVNYRSFQFRRVGNSTHSTSGQLSPSPVSTSTISVTLPQTGTQFVSITAQGYIAKIFSQPSDTQDIQQTVTLRTAPPMKILVLDPKGAPVPNSAVFIYQHGPKEFFQTIEIPATDDQGITYLQTPFEKGDGIRLNLSAKFNKLQGSVEWPCAPNKKHNADIVIILGQ